MVQGLEQLRRRLTEQIPEAIRAALEESMLTMADLIVDAARLRVPVGESGELRDSIRRTGIRTDKRGNLYVSVLAGQPTPRGFDTARLVEFGTMNMPAQPFLRPAFRANRRRARTRMRSAVRHAVIRLG